MKPKLLLFFALIVIGAMGVLVAHNAETPYAVTELNVRELPEGISHYGVANEQDFKLYTDSVGVCTDLGWISMAEYRRLKLSNCKARITSPLHTKEVGLALLTDPVKTGYDDMKAHILVFENGQPKWQLDFNGFKNLDVDWIDEKLLKIVSWPGGRVRVTELINVETGKLIYRSADGIYNRLSSPAVKINP